MMIFKQPYPTETTLRQAMTQAYRMDETQCVENLLNAANFSADQTAKIATTAKQLMTEVRKQRLNQGGLDSFMAQYDLSSEEGIALMCLAEALLRIPDAETINRLIEDKIAPANWEAHIGKNDSMFVNATTWGLMLTGKMLSHRTAETQNMTAILGNFFARTSAPIIRKATAQAMKILGKQFVMGQTIEDAIKRARELEGRGYRYSYDMLGEAARTDADAQRYFKAYQDAIAAIATAAKQGELFNNPGISVKLSALSPRYEFAQYHRAIEEVTPRLKALAKQAKDASISLTMDAEEAERLDLSLDIFASVFCDPELKGWEGLGLAVQSYQKRAWYVIDWLIDLARSQNKRVMVRLIKGAYWDTEIKVSQERGLEGYPVFTRKASTDVSFLACAKKLLANPQAFYPQFATHNAYSVAAILAMVGDSKQEFEFQALHGMGLPLYDQIVGPDKMNHPCRIYAPVGGYEDLLPYLVRRLLENGANTSFVNRIVDDTASIDDLVVDPVEKVKHLSHKPHANIPLPINIFGNERKNSRGIDLTNRQQLQALEKELEAALAKTYTSAPTVMQNDQGRERMPVLDPSDRRRQLGWVIEATVAEMEATMAQATACAFAWDATPVKIRAGYLDKTADLMEQHRAELLALIVREGGRSIPDAVAELREAVDFCRYYAAQARMKIAHPEKLPGPTGESNTIELHGRGPIACISPWNFPLAIFTGQVAASLVAGNPVIAKPARQTPLVAALAVKLFHQAGVPKEVLQLLPAGGKIIGEQLIPDNRIKGVVFTGSTQTAWQINQALAARKGPIVPFVAETGGQNVMIVDSSALLEQVVADVLSSSFNSAGQRCSALRVLFIQDEVAPKFIQMLKGAMAELVIGDPGYLVTDVGPVIDAAALAGLQAHAERMQKEGTLIYQAELGEATTHGSFFAPRAFEIKSLDQLPEEVFGAILHVIRYRARDLDNVITAINKTGYGLTLGIHTRVENTAKYIQQRAKVGNCYVNRNMIGAVVGVQPFGGEELSGTGPKAGGPHYILRLCTERTLSINTTAAGGNASLLCLGED